MPSLSLCLATPRGRGTDHMVVDLLRESASRLVASETEARFFARELSDRYEEIELLTSAGETLGSIIHLVSCVLYPLYPIVCCGLWYLYVLRSPGGER